MNKATKLVSFRLSMPGVGSYNGIWTGSNNNYVIVRKVSYEDFKKLLITEREGTRNFHYDFKDGWKAQVEAQWINSKTANERRKSSRGFCGYEWMIDSILKHGKIQT